MFIFCPKCKQKYEVDDEYAGVEVHCEKCGNAFTVQTDREKVKIPPPPSGTLISRHVTPGTSREPAASLLVVRCSDCGENVSSRAAACPHCGAPVMRSNLIPCNSCGAPVAKSAKMCPRCGAPGAKQWFSISSVISLLLLVLSLLIGIGAGMESGNTLNVIAGFLLAIWMELNAVLIKLK